MSPEAQLTCNQIVIGLNTLLMKEFGLHTGEQQGKKKSSFWKDNFGISMQNSLKLNN